MPEENHAGLIRWVGRLCNLALAILLVAAYLFILVRFLVPEPPPRRVPPQFTEQQRRYIHLRHQFHGISGSVMENGQHYFIRDGKRCRL